MAENFVTALAVAQVLHDGLKPALAASADVGYGNQTALSSRDYLGFLATDPGASRPTVGASGTTDWRTSMTTDGFDDAGEIAICAWAWNGSRDVLAVAARVFALRAEVGQYVVDNYSNQNLCGVTGLWDLKLTSYELSTFPTSEGCTAYLLFKLAYQATT